MAEKNTKKNSMRNQSIDTRAQMHPRPQLHPILIEKTEKASAYKKRHDPYYYQSIHPTDAPKYEADGWEIHRESKTRIRIKRLKSHDKLLEDQAWCLFYRMGYPEISDEHFKVRYERADSSTGTKQWVREVQ